jgi:hypothetical protein
MPAAMPTGFGSVRPGRRDPCAYADVVVRAWACPWQALPMHNCPFGTPARVPPLLPVPGTTRGARRPGQDSA